MAPDLARRTLELVNIPSESRDEQRLLEHVRHAVSLPLTYGSDEALLFATERTERPLVVLAGHLDTVPAQDNLPGRIEGGSVIGLGASDMKGGVAVMIEAVHQCMSIRGVKKPDVATITTQFTGIFKEDPAQQARFMMLATERGRL